MLLLLLLLLLSLLLLFYNNSFYWQLNEIPALKEKMVSMQRKIEQLEMALASKTEHEKWAFVIIIIIVVVIIIIIIIIIIFYYYYCTDIKRVCWIWWIVLWSKSKV